jgi:P-type Ca2+ transporter type 2C
LNPEIIQTHDISIEEVIQKFESSEEGLSQKEAVHRLELNGKNILPTKRPPTIFKIYLHQFLSPLIYILIGACVLTLVLQDYSDAFFIFLVLLVNSMIGTYQEYAAEKSAQALKDMTASLCYVQRDKKTVEISSEELVAGDLVYLESGRKVPADLRLIQSKGLEIDESLLTGESIAALKDHDVVHSTQAALGDQSNMAFTGSLVIKGRGQGIVTKTGLKTELGKIANMLMSGETAKPPLLIRMEKFTLKISVILLFVTVAMGGLLILKGYTWNEVLIFCVALSVAAIPEGLPVAITVSLSIASKRMAKRNVIVRKLPAVEALGSCSYIATDKTGTLTVNQLTIKEIVLPTLSPFSIGGSGFNPEGKIEYPEDDRQERIEQLSLDLIRAGVLCNEAQLIKNDTQWEGLGDAVDLSFLVLANKSIQSSDRIRKNYNLLEEIPFEPENLYAASLHEFEGSKIVSLKGAFEKVLTVCSKMMTLEGEKLIDKEGIVAQAEKLAADGSRVLALAKKTVDTSDKKLRSQIHDMTFLGLVGMVDPLRPEASEAIHHCNTSGIKVVMITGDHPKTAFSIAQELGLSSHYNEVISGPQLTEMTDQSDKEALIAKGRVFARVEPQQKLEIVKTLIKQGHFVAVTGDGANDAPALKAANVGIAMGKSGTDIAKETSDLIITDDRFASIIAGIEEGRISYNNIRKVIYLLISTGAAEILLFVLAMIFNTPLPLTAVQILWLNLITNGIQDIGLAFEPAEGDELKQPPRKTTDQIFNRLMIERVLLSALVMAGVSFVYFKYLLDSGVSEFTARNLTFLLMVLFENVMVGNCRSETKSAFSMNPLKNKILFFGTILAQLIHIGAIYTPGLNQILALEPVSLENWTKLLFMALSVLVVGEIYKKFRSNYPLT